MCGLRAAVHHVQANLPRANTTTHPIRNRKIETAKLACLLNSLSPSLIRDGRRLNIARRNRNNGIAAATKAMILRIIVHNETRTERAQLGQGGGATIVIQSRTTGRAAYCASDTARRGGWCSDGV